MKAMKRGVCMMLMTLGLSTTLAHAEGPLFPLVVPGAPVSIRTLLEQRQDYERVIVQGRVIRRVEHDELFEFSDGSASILLKVDRKHWPYPVRVDATALLEAVGEFDYERGGDSKLKVFELRPVR